MSSSKQSGLRDVLRRLDKAARALTPVVLDQGRDQAKLGSYLDRIESDAAGQWLWLAPIAADGIAPLRLLPPSGIRVCSTVPGEPWALCARRIEPAGDRAARVLIDERARLVDLPARDLARVDGPGREPLVLVVPTATDDRDLHVFPVIGLSASHGMIESTVPLVPGTRYDPVELLGDGRILRRAAATVLEAIPWRSAQGARLFRCRLALSEAHAEESGRAHDLVSQPQRIKRCLDLAAMMSRPAWLEAGGSARLQVKITAATKDCLRLTLGEEAPGDIAPHVTVGFELFGASYELDVRLLAREAAHIDVSLPLLLRRRRWRREKRAEDHIREKLTVSFRNPATGAITVRKIRDLSFGGLCFEADARTDVLWKRLPMEQVSVMWNAETVHLGDMEVRALERRAGGLVLAHAAGRGDAARDETGLINLLAAVRNPEVRMHDGSDFRAMLDIYRRAGLVADFMLRNLEPVAPIAATNWRRLHDRKADVAFTLVYPAVGTPQVTFSGVRAWNFAWLSQHFGATSTQLGHGSGAVHVAYVDHVLPRSDAHHFVFFMKEDSLAMGSFQGHFLEVAGTPEAVSRVRLNYWVGKASGTDGRPLSCKPRSLRRGEEKLIARAAERLLGTAPARALSMVEGGLSLSDTRARFRKAGLERSRKVHVLGSGGVAALALLEERTSPGVNLTLMLNAWWILPVVSEAAEGGDVMTAAAQAILCSAGSGDDRFVITVDGTNVGALEAAGFERLADVWLYVMNRSGIYRYCEYIADRYGNVGARSVGRKTVRTLLEAG